MPGVAVKEDLRTDSERGMTLDQHGVERGVAVADFLGKTLPILEEARVLDLGCGLAGISIAVSRRARQVVGVDWDYRRRLQTATARVRERGIRNLSFLCGNSLALPFREGTFDAVVMNGLLEWLGRSDRNRRPDETQIAALREVRRVLKPGGILYIGIENRWYPAYLVRDPHVHLPLVNALPRSWADAFSLRLTGERYDVHIYSRRSLERIIRLAGYEHVEFFIPILHYQYPLEIISADDRKEFRRAVLGLPRKAASEAFLRAVRGRLPLKLFFWRMIALLGLGGTLAASFVVLCRPSGEVPRLRAGATP